MRDDLLHAQASIDWAVTQLPSLQQRLNAWLNENIYIDLRDPNPEGPNNVIVAVEKDQLPLTFTVEVGAYINAIRSSLDILAVSLAYRYGIPKPDSAYFPVASDATQFASGGYKGSEFVKGLPDIERLKIEALKPYDGGNRILWPLHRLDIMRKHKRLLSTIIHPSMLRVVAWGFTPPGDFIPGHDGETILGLIAKGVMKPQIELTPQVAIDEPALIRKLPVVIALREFAKFATGVIADFDTP